MYSETTDGLTVHDLPSPNRDARTAGIDMLVLHYTGMRTAEEALGRLCDPQAEVSAHYTVDEGGVIYRHVPEEQRAWHAGVSFWRGRTDSNARSVGIEIVNPGHEFGYHYFPALQMAAVCELCLGILARHVIPARNVVAHSDIAPTRKIDPGELFDWPGMAQNGIGLWPQAGSGPMLAEGQVKGALEQIGYDPSVDQGVLLRAFQRHWLPQNLSGQPDLPTRQRLGDVMAAVTQT